jgi:hypothetical protein
VSRINRVFQLPQGNLFKLSLHRGAPLPEYKLLRVLRDLARFNLGTLATATKISPKFGHFD